ncbi:MAG: RagB/SusD family nutrient uptake outer membrane protein [Bernardetiaceae bacterium]
MKTKTNSIRCILLILPFFFLSACQDWIAIAPNLEQNLPAVPTNATELEELLRGGYATTSETGLYGDLLWLTGTLPVGWLLGETFWDDPASPLDAIAFSRMQANNTAVAQLWQRAYQAILTTNIVLRNSDLAGAMAPQLRAEALCMRALLYVELLENFSVGKPEQSGVPLIDENTTDNFPARATRGQVYARIREDLRQAIADLPERHPEHPFRWGSKAAQALLARVAAQQQDWAEVYALTQSLLAASLILEEDPRRAFTDPTSEEVLFAFRTNTLGSIYAERILVLNAHLNRYAAEDRRRAFFVPEGSRWRCQKWNNGNFVPVLRSAEIYLLDAEAALQLNQNPSALNFLRNRAGLPAIPIDGLAEIQEERQRELAYEGHALRDVRRWRLSPGGVPFDDPRLVLPIPSSELAINPNLVQNEGY